MRNYNFFMIGRTIDSKMYVGTLVWIKGTIQVEEKNKESITELLKKNIAKVLKLTQYDFEWRDVSLLERSDKGCTGIQIEDIGIWSLYKDDWEGEIGILEFKNYAENITEWNSKLLEL